MATYNKLVRDRIPAIIAEGGSTCSTRVLEETEYRAQLRTKLYEELDEYMRAGDDSSAVEELADILELLHTLAGVHGSSPEQLEAVRRDKAEKRGGFRERVYLMEVTENQPGK
ncbi:nucleoside triphosphate pyrophosphohydrolase [Paenibacillus tarimensis]|uniref:nucleoside triphosphate pyrophosphohydrolase n=1 Tax=Paenibacillus tarimensis TaxID=416012 RepID=UPI001F47BE0A|nr:nucleoside triphosphate pyrophosphohydrolase [Paenibacillus tarimensis]MCF2945359.1 nucleoside triphosphate pyrophosphohydrolase [Paenibacillus tarimensis]